MMRLGPWVFVAGIALLCAGMASTHSDAWKWPDSDVQLVPLDAQGVDAIDLGRLLVNEVVVARGQPQLRIQWYQGARDGHQLPFTTARDGNALRLTVPPGKGVSGNVSLVVPTSVASLSGTRLSVKTTTDADKLFLDASNVIWAGNARELAIHARVWPGDNRRGCRAQPTVDFQYGVVERVRISIERGVITLGDISKAGHIEIHAGPDVGLQVRRIEDLRRIELLPFDGATTSPPDGAADADCTSNSVEATL
jgi:hypothetical protein